MLDVRFSRPHSIFAIDLMSWQNIKKNIKVAQLHSLRRYVI